MPRIRMAGRFRVGALTVALTAGLVAGPPAVMPAAAAGTTCNLVPVLRDFTINQGVGTYRDLARGKDSLLKLFLSLPSCASRSAVIQMRGGSVAVKVGGATIGSVGATSPTVTSPFPQIAPYGSAPSLDAPGDPKWVIPGSMLQPLPLTDTFDATFEVTLTYATAPDSRTTPVVAQTTFPLATYLGTTAPLRFRKANALRLLVVPMGDLTKTTPEQFPSTARQAVEKGMLALSRLLPVQYGVGNLGSTTGGVRYAFNPTLLDLSKVSGAFSPTTGRFCGGSTNWNGIKAQLAQFLQAWNTANPGATADRVVGVVSSTISDGSGASCAEGFASFDSTAAWVRAIPDANGSPSPTGALMAMELSHLVALQPSPRSTTTHSKNIQADGGTNRGYNVTFRAYVSNDKTALRFDTTTGPWNNDVTLLEREDYEFWQCKLGGPSNLECTTPNVPVGTSSGVGAGPHFVISGTTDGSPGGTRIVESYFATNVAPTEPDAASTLRLVFVENGSDALDIGLRRYDEDSHHGDDPDESTPSLRPFFSAAVPLGDLGGVGGFDRVELRQGATILYARDRNGRPVVSGTTAVAAGDPINLSSDPGLDDESPVLSPDGQTLAWVRSVGDGVRSIAVAPAGNLGSPSTLPLGGRPRRIAFASGGEIFTMNPDGSGLFQVTNDPGVASEPSWSPASDNSDHIVFTSDRDGDPEIFVIKSDGTGEAQLTSNTVADRSPSWSPDGLRIAFSRDVAGSGTEIFVMDSVGGNQQDVLPLANDVPDIQPVWAPDGTRIAFIRQFAANDGRIRVVSLNGLGLRGFPDPPGDQSRPTWSPDGRRLAFSSAPGGDLYVIDAHENGLGTLRQLTSDPNWNDTSPAWSPDGATIAFARLYVGPPPPCTNPRVCVTVSVRHFWRVPAEGGEALQITNLSTADEPPNWSSGIGGVTDLAWSPDGSQVALTLDGNLHTAQVLNGALLGVTGAEVVSVRAGVTSLTGEVARALAPASAEIGPANMSSDSFAFAFDERLDQRLTAGLGVDITNANGVSVGTVAALSPGTIPAGTVVDSYMLHANRAGAATTPSHTGSVTFDREILGIILTNARLDASDSILGSPLTTYGTGDASRGMDVEIAGNPDRVSLSVDRRTVTFTMVHSSATDQFRVITRSAPALFRPSWSSDGSTVAVDDGSNVFTTQLGAGEFGPLVGTSAHGRNASWSRTVGDNRLVFESDGDLLIDDPATAAAPVLFAPDASEPDFSSGRVAFVRNGDIWSVDATGADARQHSSSAGTDRSPSIAAGRLIFERRFPLSSDILVSDLDLRSVAFTATDGDSAEVDLTAQVLLRCGGFTYPLAVGVQPDALTDTVAILQSNLDPTYACGSGTPELITLVSDGVERSDPLDPGATTPAGGFVGATKDPVAAIHAPAIGDGAPATFLEWQAVPLGGQGYDPEARVLDEGAHVWSVNGPSYPGGQAVGTGPSIDLEGPGGADFLPGLYTATLTVTDASGQTSTDTRTFRIVADDDGDGLDDALEAGSGGCIAPDPEDPQKDAFGDADADGIPNIDDLQTANGPCAADVPADTQAPLVTVDDGAPGPGPASGNPALVPVSATDTLLADGAGGGLRGVVCLVDGEPAPVTPEVGWGAESWSGTVEVSGVGTHAISCTATDVAWNAGSDADDVVVAGGASPVVTVTHTSPTSGWYIASPVTVTVGASDDVALLSLSCTVDASPAALSPAFAPGSASYSGTLSVAGDGSHDVACTAGDGATTDDDTTSVGIDLDNPTIGHGISPTAPDGAAGWYITGPTVTFSCADGRSGIASCLADGQATASRTLGESASGQIVGGTAIDNAGRQATNSTAPINVDLSNPTLTCATPAPTFTRGTSGAVVTASVADAISGPAAATASAPANTSADGSFTVVVTGTDNAGRSGTASCPYTVTAPTGFTFTGFFDPVDNPPTVNTGRRQKMYAVSFQLRTSAGVIVTNTSEVTSAVTTALTCSTLATNPRDALETTTRQRAGTLTYSATTQRITYSWSSDRKAGCYQLVLTFSDGSTRSALFDVR